MPKKRFTNEQITFALRQAENGTLVAEICRKMEVAEATFYRWERVYAGMGVAEAAGRGPQPGQDDVAGCPAKKKW